MFFLFSVFQINDNSINRQYLLRQKWIWLGTLFQYWGTVIDN